MDSDTVWLKTFVAPGEGAPSRMQDDLQNPQRLFPAPGRALDGGATCFVAHSGERVVWLHLSPADNNPPVFWRLFVRGVRLWLPGFGERMAEQPFPETAPAARRLLEELSGQMGGGERVVLALNHCRCLDDEAVVLFLDLLAEARVENLSVLLLSHGRVYRRLPVAAAGQLLRFSREALRVYYTAMDIRLPVAGLNRVYRLTGGWTAAAVMLGEHLQTGEALTNRDVDAAVLMVYRRLDRELFDPLQPDLQRALVLLSLADAFSLEMAACATGTEQRELLEVVEDTDLAGYRPESRQYYFMELFHRYLQRKQAALTGQERAGFLTKAGDWCASHGMQYEAVNYYYNAGRLDCIEALLLSMDYVYPDVELCIECLRIMNLFPEGYLEEKPELRFVQAAMLWRMGEDIEARKCVEALLPMLRQQPASEEAQRLTGESMVVMALYHLRQGSESYIHLLREAVSYLPQGSGVFTKGQVPYVSNRNAMPFPNSAPGELGRLRKLLFAAMPYRERLMGGYAAGREHLAAAEVEYYQGNLQEAKKLAYEALPKALAGEQWDIVCCCYYYLQRIAVAGGILEDAEAHLGRIRTYADRLSDYGPFTLADIAESGFSMKLGLYDKVADWVRDDTLPPGGMNAHDQSRELVMKAGYLFITRKPYDALTFINRAVGLCGDSGQWFPKLKLLILEALVYDALEEYGISARVLQSAYGLSSGNDILMPYIEYGRHTRLLITHVRSLPAGAHSLPEQWLDLVAARAGTYEKRFGRLKKAYFAKHNTNRYLTDSLTDREQMVLRLVCQGMTNEEIAEDLGMQVSAVTGALKRIYPKLGAANRADAVRIAMLVYQARDKLQ